MVLSTRWLVLGPLRRGFGCRPRSAAAACALPRATWYELQSGLQLVATFSGLGGAWERLSCGPRPAPTSAGFGAAFHAFCILITARFIPPALI